MCVLLLIMLTQIILPEISSREPRAQEEIHRRTREASGHVHKRERESTQSSQSVEESKQVNNCDFDSNRK